MLSAFRDLQRHPVVHTGEQLLGTLLPLRYRILRAGGGDDIHSELESRGVRSGVGSAIASNGSTVATPGPADDCWLSTTDRRAMRRR